MAPSRLTPQMMQATRAAFQTGEPEKSPAQRATPSSGTLMLVSLRSRYLLHSGGRRNVSISASMRPLRCYILTRFASLTLPLKKTISLSMIPSVFISSTVEDLTHLRDAVRDTVIELSYIPVSSEYGDIGYLPAASAEESCYKTVADCNLAVVLIGKRYGSLSINGLSVTQNEFRTAKDNKIPVISLVDKEAINFKKVFDANRPRKQPSIFPGMDAPQKTFSFIQEIIDSPVNNGILIYANVTEVREHLKRQLAHIFGDLLRGRFDPLRAEVKDILAEIKTLRHELLDKKGIDPHPYLKAVRFFLDEQNERYRTLISQLSRDVELAIPVIFKSETFESLLQNLGFELKLKDSQEEVQKLNEAGGSYFYSTETLLAENIDSAGVDGVAGALFISRDKEVVMNRAYKEHFEGRHNNLQRLFSEPQK